MIILGDISGIQHYLFDIAEAGGGQARRLRARSFFIQLLAECAALQILRKLGWPTNEEHFLLSGAGKFLLRGRGTQSTEQKLCDIQVELTAWLLRETRGELRIVLGWSDHPGSEVEAYQRAQQQLLHTKGRPHGPLAGGCWQPTRLVMAPLETPCSLCGHATAIEDEHDNDTGEIRRVCRTCADNRRLGQQLPQSRWLVIRENSEDGEFDIMGLGVTLSQAERVAINSSLVALANCQQSEICPAWCPNDRFLPRRLMAYIPVSNGSPVWFTELANRATGNPLLAVLKADADSLGAMIAEILGSQAGLEGLARFSKDLDGFFAGRLKEEIEQRDSRWRSIYTIFAGGDDLVMVGPWDVMLDFAGRISHMFQDRFGDRKLTLSAGLALFKPKRPIKTAVTEAERLLEEAKTTLIPGESAPKDQCAAFGQCWKWKHHGTILKDARQLVTWVSKREMQRGWLHTLLELAERRHGSTPELSATAHLAYHVDRNYRKGSSSRHWAQNLVANFDNPTQVKVRYLPAILRYALTATRTVSDEE